MLCAQQNTVGMPVLHCLGGNAFYPRDAMRLSVCPFVTRRYCVKTKKASGMISSPSGSPKTLVFQHQILSPNSKGFPPNGGLKEGSVGKIQRFF